VEAEPSDQLIIRVLFDDTLLRQLNIIVLSVRNLSTRSQRGSPVLIGSIQF
jgi:hypothetical protein